MIEGFTTDITYVSFLLVCVSMTDEIAVRVKHLVAFCTRKSCFTAWSMEFKGVFRFENPVALFAVELVVFVRF